MRKRGSNTVLVLRFLDLHCPQTLGQVVFFSSDNSQTQFPPEIITNGHVDITSTLGETLSFPLDDISHETAALLALTSIAHHGEFGEVVYVHYIR